MLRCYSNRNSEGVACCGKSDIGYLQKHFFPKEIENIFVKILLPKTKLLIVGIIYRPPNQIIFLAIINANINKLDTGRKGSYILGDFNINMYESNKFIVHDDNTISSNFLSSNMKNWHQFCKMHDLKQLIKSRTCVTCSTLTIIYHILASFPRRVSRKGVIDINLFSDHQLIFCRQKSSHLKTGGIHKYLNFCSSKNYAADSYQEALKQLDFPN